MQVSSGAGTILIEHTHGFALGRVIADEAELLTIAVMPEARRQGVARELLTKFEHQAQAGGATQIFLEVAARNSGALALYHLHEYAQVGRRKGYYRGADGAQDDGIVMAKPISDTDLS